MNEPPNETRYIGMDIHKRYAVIGGVNRDQAVVYKPKKVSYEGWRRWIRKHLRATDEVVIEATGNTWQMVDDLKPMVKRVVVAHARNVKLIAAARVKTDKVDALNLARLLAANLIPEVWVPSVPVREVRRLIAQRWQITRGRVRVQNELHSLLHRHNIVAPAGQGTLFRAISRPFWQELDVSTTGKLQIQHNLAQLDLFNQQQEEIDGEIARLSRTPQWEPQVRLLLQLPGFGALTAMTILGAIGEIGRFESAKKLVGYAGLGASIRASGGKSHSGAITKAGRKDLRRAMIHAAHMAARSHPHWQRQYQEMCRRMPKQKAIVAIARKLLVVIWHVLTKREVDQHSSVERIGYRMAIWYWGLPKTQKEGFSRAQFVRWQLLQLGIGHDLTHIPLPNATKPSQRLRLSNPEDAQAIFG
ncbi:MAG: IS110 family transposase [Ardenticatenaceae bacterium]|nr:MAG: IS110 family transposase [Ardenticatenaceae bacterium]